MKMDTEYPKHVWQIPQTFSLVYITVSTYTLHRSAKYPHEERPRCYQGLPSFPAHRPAPERMDHLAAHESLQKETIALQRQRTDLQRQQKRIVELLAQNKNRTKLPQPRVPVFDGNPMEYRTLVHAFESSVESRTFSSTDRLYYLEQFTAGDVRELVRFCHHLTSDEGYDEARRKISSVMNTVLCPLARQKLWVGQT